MGEVVKLFPELDEVVYECACGSVDFWIRAQVSDLSSFSGLQCQWCNAFYKFPQPLKRADILVYEEQE